MIYRADPRVFWITRPAIVPRCSVWSRTCGRTRDQSLGVAVGAIDRRSRGSQPDLHVSSGKKEFVEGQSTEWNTEGVGSCQIGLVSPVDVGSCQPISGGVPGGASGHVPHQDPITAYQGVTKAPE